MKKHFSQSSSKQKGYYGLALGALLSFTAFLLLNQQISDDVEISSWVVTLFSVGVIITIVAYAHVMKLYINEQKAGIKSTNLPAQDDSIGKKAIKASKKTVKKSKKKK